MDFIKDESIVRYENGEFIRQFRWNTQVVTSDSDIKSGYIVQHIIRNTEDNLGIYQNNKNYNHEYWEAWPVDNNKIVLPSESDFDDLWASNYTEGWDYITREYKTKWMQEIQDERMGSSGVIKVSGELYWAPTGSELQIIVDETFVEKIEWARELQAAYIVRNASRFSSCFVHLFCNSWDLTNSKTIVDPLRQVDNPFWELSNNGIWRNCR